MKNLMNNIFLVTLIFLIPLLTEGKTTEKKSFIQQIKEKITEEKEKIEEKKSDEESRIKKVKDKIIKEEKKIEDKAAEKKKKEKDKYKNDYDHYKNKKYYKNKYKYDDYSYNRYPHWNYDDIYFNPYVTSVGYYDYTYVDEPELILSNPINTNRIPRRVAFLNSSVEAAYLGKDIDDTYGVTAKISANLYSLHFNCFYQNIFSSEESLTLYSINGGINLATQSFIFTPFIGAFYIEPLEEARFSYGADLQIFLPYNNYNLDFYTLNSSYGSLNFHNFSASLNYEFYKLNFGLGFTYNSYAGISFSGPLAKFSFSL